ncbi:acetoacetate decarboxylase family protein [Streptomyces sp. NPDC094032]|uniref:acetoacetate decarboxylase family protein n=1 Tax=Streptomyces sp. NPDC094032 TaxID=3155308 RepID=UPI0033312A9D
MTTGLGASRLAGYTLPLSPSGRAAMVTPPPWHFSGTFIWVDYTVDPERAARFLPPGMELSETGAAAAAFSSWQWCGDGGAELEEPAHSQFSEFMVLLSVTYRGRPAARCPYAWVDHAVPMIRGWIQGMPKQFGSVHMTRTVSAGLAGPRRRPGSVYRGSLAVHDHRVADVRVSLTGPADEPPALNSVPLVHTRVFPPWIPQAPGVYETVASDVTGAEYSAVWTGAAELRFSPQLLDDPDFGALAPVGIGPGYVFEYGETLLGGLDADTWEHPHERNRPAQQDR